MPFPGRLLAAALTLAIGAAHAAEPAQEPLTTPHSPLYQPSPEVRAQVKDVLGNRQPRPLPAPASEPAIVAEPATLTEVSANNPVPRSLVTVAQRELSALGYDAGPVDGVAGPKTRQAVKAFQADKGLPTDGLLTFDLLSKLMVRTKPAITPPPPPAPPAPPPVVSFSLRRAIGKTVHAQSGDLLGTVDGFVAGPDQTIASMVMATANGYGTHEGKVAVPFALVGHAITRAAVILPLTADKALPLRDKLQAFQLTEGQRLLGTGDEADATADTDGKLLK